MKLYRFNLYILVLLTLLVAVCISCDKEWLDEKSDKSLVVPATLKDFEKLLDNSSEVMNNRYPILGELGADDYYLDDATWSASYAATRNSYIWAKDIFEGQTEYDWNYPYKRVFYANTVLEGLAKITVTSQNQTQYNALKGRALFFRAHAFYSIAELFAPVYNKLTADGELGIPLRLKADMNEKSERSTLEQTYQQILSDLKDAALLLPQTDSYKTRPVKAAALGLMARVYLSMSDYENAFAMANEALKLNTTLLDYNTLDLFGYNPFLPFNEEMVFYAQLSYNEALYPGYFNVDSALIDLYQPDDLRLKAFFLRRSNGTYSYMGSYSPQYLFGGIANDELLLIRAECYARKGEVNLAMDDLNYLLKNRIERQSFVPLSAQSKEEALAAVLKERRKELVYRGLRWTDLRRLNLEPDKTVTLRRKVAGVSYELPPNDKRYVYPIPEDVLKSSGMSQNER